MPTPRHANQIMQQIRTAPPLPSAESGRWISGAVASVPQGDAPGTVTVRLDSGAVVNVGAAIDDPLSVGTGVWVVDTGGGHLVVGLQ